MNASKVNKMVVARVIFGEIFTRGYTLPEGKTQRAHFIARAQAEIPMSGHGAATYYQNLTNEAGGKGTYKYNKVKSKKVVEVAEEMVFALTHQMTERWMAINGNGYEVNSFKTRSAAQAFAKDNGCKWADRQAA